MSMLAEPRRRKVYQLNPRGKALYEDDSRFGTKMLEKMGWSKGKGLGARENGSLDFVRVRYKDDAQGLGFDADAKDDKWTEHEQNFSGLLKSLNGETDDVEECNESNEMRPVGFGFKIDPVKTQKKSKKLTENISGESLEEKSKASKARVHYKKFTRGKDLSRYSEKDLANIFGKKVTDDQAEKLFNSETVEHTNSEENEVNPNMSGVQIITTGLSVSDYFKQKMEALKNKLNNGNKAVECQSLLDENEVPANENEPEKNCNKKSKRGFIEEIDQNEDLEEPKRKKKKQKIEITIEQAELLEMAENEEPKRKKKRKDVDEEQEPSKTTEVELEIYNEPMNDKEKSKKKKKAKKENIEERIESQEKNTNQTEDHVLLLGENTDSVNDNERSQKKKKKKPKKEHIEERIESQEKSTNQTEDPALLLGENTDYVNDNERRQKKKNKKAKQEQIEERIEIQDQESIRPVEEINTKKTKKSKKNKELTSKEETCEDQIDEAKFKKMKKKTKLDEDAVPLAPHDVSETLQNNQIHIDESSNDERNASEVTRPEEELLSMDQLLKKRDSYDVFTISSFCAEEFRHFNMSAYKGSTLSQIIGYGFNENLKLNIIETARDEKRIVNLWMSKRSKYGNEKQDQKRHLHTFAKIRNKKVTKRHLKAFTRRNIFDVI